MGRAYEVRKASMAKSSAAKSKVYAKFGKEIYQAAKNGAADIELNSNLKRIVEKARSNQVPADIINRAIEKANGASKDSYDSILYEGFSIGGSQIMIECLTDNVNRTISEVRNCFTKTNGKLGVSGSLQHQFIHVALFEFTGDIDENIVLEKLMDEELEYIKLEVANNEGFVTCDITLYNTMRNALESINESIEFQVSEIVWEPISYVELSSDDRKTFDKLILMLEDCEDVQDIYHNVGVLNE